LENNHTKGAAQQNARMTDAATRSIGRSVKTFDK
jgi:hypothetical protein